MRIIAFIIDAYATRDFLAHHRATPHRTHPRPAVLAGRQRRAPATFDPALPTIPAYEFDQRLVW